MKFIVNDKREEATSALPEIRAGPLSWSDWNLGKSSRRPASAQSSANRPRTIVCCLRDWKVRETILKSARRIKPDNIFVKEDLSPVTLEKRESQRPKLEAAKRAGKIAYFVLDKLVIRDRPNVGNS